MNLRQRLEEWAVEADEPLIFFDGYDDAIVGIVERMNQPSVVLYDVQKCIEVLVKDGMSYEDAEEFFDFNTRQAWVGEQTPAFLVAPWAPTFGIPPVEEA